MTRAIHGEEVHGVGLDRETRCAHYASGRDIVAIRFHCCGVWYSCRACHDELARHEASVWPAEQSDARAILCAVCGTQLTISDYRNCGSTCPQCGAPFNPGCANHHEVYFEPVR